MSTPTITSQRLPIIPLPFDAKRSNCYISGSDFVIETIPEYLLRVTQDIRDVHVVSILVPKDGYVSLGTYPLATISADLANFDTKLYSFTEGLADANFTEIIPTAKEYNVTYSQSGGSAPVGTILTNSLGTITPSRVSTGTYNLTSSGLFISGKTIVNNGHDLLQDAGGNLYVITWVSVNVIQITTYSSADISVLADGVLNNRYINIKVYA
jgi:hypothetical protein